MELSLRSERRLASTATVTGRRDPQVDASVRGADFSWPKTRTFGGHECGPLLAISADFLVATDTNLWSSQADRDAYSDAAIPTIGMFKVCPPMEPKKGERKEKTPPSEATVQ